MSGFNVDSNGVTSFTFEKDLQRMGDSFQVEESGSGDGRCGRDHSGNYSVRASVEQGRLITEGEKVVL